jgi:hypothetical protein
MEKKLILLALLVFLMSCTVPAKFVITEKHPTGVFDNCSVSIKPINKKAKRMKNVTKALIGCDQENIGDTLIITRKTFANL